MRMAQRHSFGTSRKWLLDWKGIQSYQVLFIDDSTIDQEYAHSRSWRLGEAWDEPDRSWSFGGFDTDGRRQQIHHFSLQYSISFAHTLRSEFHPKFHDPATYKSVIHETENNNPAEMILKIRELNSRVEDLEKLISKLPRWLLESVS